MEDRWRGRKQETFGAVRVAHRLRSYFLIPWGIDEMISPLPCGRYDFHSMFHTSLISGRSTTQRVSSKEDIKQAISNYREIQW